MIIGPTDQVLYADILVVDDTPANLQLLTAMLKGRGHKVRPVLDGNLALQAARNRQPDLILLDVNMPGLDGFEVCTQLKAEPLLAKIPVIFISANAETMDKVKAFALGGVDYITKPFQFEEVEARVETHLKLRHLQQEIEGLNNSLHLQVSAQVREITYSQVATILALAKLSETRDEGTGNHIFRVQRYCQALVCQLAKEQVFGNIIDDCFIDTIFHASALHDIGKVGIPDSILLKPGKFTDNEFAVMKTHTTLGAETLAAVVENYPHNALVRMGVEVARSHHEHWDGSGYPEGLGGEDIPLAARIVMLADQYDALRNKRPYKQAISAAESYTILTQGDSRSNPAHLDPRVLKAFSNIASEFEAIFDDLGG